VFAVYPAAAVFCLLLMTIILVTTRGRRRNTFDRQLHRMKRQARSRLLLISDKAWEPEYCITVDDFGTLVRTARKLKHPVFCCIDRRTEPSTAYFYIYYGENNFCFTFTDNQADQAPDDPDEYSAPSVPAGPPVSLPPEPARPASRGKPAGPADTVAPEQPIPVLPETDSSSEVRH
jgi:hypothetical protein